MGADRASAGCLWALIASAVLLPAAVASAPAAQIEYQVAPGEWEAKDSVYVEKGRSLRLRFQVPNSVSTRWYQIIPDIRRYYKNANHPWEEDAYAWSGFGRIRYHRREIPGFRDQTEVEVSPRVLQRARNLAGPFYNWELGSFWFQVESVLESGVSVGTPGLEAGDHRGLSPRVFRVSYITGRDYLGYLTSFFNVPGLFGSVPYQSRNYIGADCADVLVAASGVEHDRPVRDVNVAMLVASLPKRASLEVRGGTPDKQLAWGEDIEPGDYIAVRYLPSAQFAHIGALYSDANESGFLDREDLVLHAGPHALHFSSLGEGGFDGEVVILRRQAISP